MSHALFLGCTVPIRALGYEQATRQIAKRLGLNLIDLNFLCCGFPLEPIKGGRAYAYAAYNIALAEKRGVDIVALCSACTGMLTKVNHRLPGGLPHETQAVLDTLNVGSLRGVKIRHLARFLYEDYGVERIRDEVVRPLEGLRVAVHYGCHYLRPSEIYEGFDDWENPHTVDELVEATGAESVPFDGRVDCCGGALIGYQEELASRMAEATYGKTDGADLTITICPFCGLMYNRYQRTLGEGGRPMLYYPQLLGVALGLEASSLGIKSRSVVARVISERVRG
ncbi:MAG: CoB--CoM heterodisulfide reductase iron-sulfur subunit B family protein [Candidatus Geothermarchaeales archaeon]